MSDQTPEKQPGKDPSVVTQLLDALRQAQQPPASASYFLVEESEAEPGKVYRFDSRDGLVAKLKELNLRKGAYTKAYVFEGRRLLVSRGPLRYLLDGDDRLPLFDVPEALEPDEEGSLGEQAPEGVGGGPDDAEGDPEAPDGEEEEGPVPGGDYDDYDPREPG